MDVKTNTGDKIDENLKFSVMIKDKMTTVSDRKDLVVWKSLLFMWLNAVPVIVMASLFIHDEVLNSDIRFILRMNELHSAKYQAMIFAYIAIATSGLFILGHICLIGAL